MQPLLRNSYLQMRHSDVNARHINLAIDDLLARPKLPYDLDPPFLTDPCNPCQSYYVGVIPIPTRTNLAFLDWEIPELIKGIKHPEAVQANRVMATLCDRLKNPELAFRAVELGILPKIAFTLRNHNKFMRVCAARLVEIMASHGGLSWQFIKMGTAISGLMWVLTDPYKIVRVHAATAIKALTKIPWVADRMVERGFLQSLKTAIAECTNDLIMITLLGGLENLVERDPDKAVEHDLLKDMIWKIRRQILDEEDEQIVSAALQVITQLGRSSKGQEEADNYDAINHVIKTIHSEKPKVYTSAVMAMQILTITTKSRWRARESPSLCKRLIELSSIARNSHAKRCAMQTLNQLCEISSTRSYLIQNIDDIKEVETGGDALLEMPKRDLLRNVLWRPYDKEERDPFKIPKGYFRNKTWAETETKSKLLDDERGHTLSQMSVSTDKSLSNQELRMEIRSLRNQKRKEQQEHEILHTY